MAQRQRPFAALLHWVAFQRRHHRRGSTGNIDGGGGDAATAHAGHIDAGTGHQRRGHVQAVGQRQQQRQRQGRGQTGNRREHGADQKTGHHIEQHRGIEQQTEARQHLGQEVHGSPPACRPAASAERVASVIMAHPQSVGRRTLKTWLNSTKPTAVMASAIRALLNHLSSPENNSITPST